jgi:hypothetical protein
VVVFALLRHALAHARWEHDRRASRSAAAPRHHRHRHRHPTHARMLAAVACVWFRSGSGRWPTRRAPPVGIALRRSPARCVPCPRSGTPIRRARHSVQLPLRPPPTLSHAPTLPHSQRHDHDRNPSVRSDHRPHWRALCSLPRPPLRKHTQAHKRTHHTHKHTHNRTHRRTRSTATRRCARRPTHRRVCTRRHACAR